MQPHMLALGLYKVSDYARGRPVGPTVAKPAVGGDALHHTGGSVDATIGTRPLGEVCWVIGGRGGGIIGGIIVVKGGLGGDDFL